MRRSLVLLLLCTLCLPAFAQNVDIEALAGLQFNFSNPGARALGMGGAFLGRADDASAAEANPAGLTVLRKAEVSFEVRNYLEQQVFSTSGTFPDIERTAFTHHSNAAVLTFASAVVPVGKFTLGAYFHEPLNNEGGGFVAPQFDEFTGRLESLPPNFFLPTERRGDDTVPIGDPISQEQCEQRRINDPFSCLEYRVDPFVSALSVRQRTFGISGAWQVHPRFSVGVTARHQRFMETAATFRYNDQLVPTDVLIQATARVKDGEVDLVEESDTTFALGFKWSPRDNLHFGGVYKQGPEFEAPLFYQGELTDYEFVQAANTKFHIPDIAGVGVSYEPISGLSLNLDAVRVKYSNLVDDFVAANANVDGLDDPFRAADVTEMRFGAEYLFPTAVPFALRAGYWRDPAHSIEWNGPLNHDAFVAEALLYPEGEDQDHITVGFGLSWPRFQIDAAYDTSDRYKVGSISMVTRF